MQTEPNKIKVAVFQWAIAHYRKCIFRRLQDYQEIDYTICASDRYLGKMVSPDEFSYHLVRMIRFQIPIIKLQITYFPYLVSSLLKKEYDTVIVPNDLGDISVWLALFLGRLGFGKVCLWGHGTSRRYRGFSNCVRKFMMSLSAAVLFYTDTTRDFWIQKGLLSNKMFVAYNSLDTDLSDLMKKEITDVDLDRFRQEQGLTDKKVILSVGRLWGRKLLPILFEAVGRLRNDLPNIQVVIVGDGPAVPALKESAQSFRVQDIVCFKGAVYDEKTLAHYWLSADVTVIPAAAGLSVQHAFAYGVPVIIGDDYSTHGPEAALVKDRQTGLICEHGNIDQFTEAIRKILTDDTLRSTLSENAGHVISDKYNLDTMAEGFHQLVRHCAGRSTSNRMAEGEGVNA